VATGEGLAPGQQERIATAIDRARTEHGLDVSVLVGDLVLDDVSQFRAAAERLHAALGERSGTAVLIVAAPGQRRVEIVTGQGVRRRVPDRVAALAVLAMTTAFTGGDLAGGVVDAIRQIADAAGRRPGLPPADHKRAELAAHPESVHGTSSAPAIGAGAH
jgi:uncharacterized membrane protein YgcG